MVKGYSRLYLFDSNHYFREQKASIQFSIFPTFLMGSSLSPILFKILFYFEQSTS
jgi:hypothetical protein